MRRILPVPSGALSPFRIPELATFSSAIKAVPTGVSRPSKKLLVKNKLPDLSKYDDIADFFEKLVVLLIQDLTVVIVMNDG